MKLLDGLEVPFPAPLTFLKLGCTSTRGTTFSPLLLPLNVQFQVPIRMSWVQPSYILIFMGVDFCAPISICNVRKSVQNTAGSGTPLYQQIRKTFNIFFTHSQT